MTSDPAQWLLPPLPRSPSASTRSVQGVLRKEVDLRVRLPEFQARPVQPSDLGQVAPPLTFSVEALNIYCRISNRTVEHLKGHRGDVSESSLHTAGQH